VKLVEVPWARTGSGFTLLFEAMVLALVKSMTVAAVARLVGEQDTRLWRVVHHYVEVAREEVSHAAVRRVGVDETSLKRGHHYLTLFVDLDGTRVLFATEGREAPTPSVPSEKIWRPTGGTRTGSGRSAWTCPLPTERDSGSICPMPARSSPSMRTDPLTEKPPVPRHVRMSATVEESRSSCRANHRKTRSCTVRARVSASRTSSPVASWKRIPCSMSPEITPSRASTW